jgi:hypothetical protein
MRRSACGQTSAWISPVATPHLAPIVMATLTSALASPFCRPEEDPFLLLESTLCSAEQILLRRRGLPLRRTWIEQPYGEEEITLLEEEVIPAIQHCLARIEELDARLQQLSGFITLHLSGRHPAGLVLRRRIQVLGNDLLGDLSHAST